MRSDPLTVALFIHGFKGAVASQMHRFVSKIQKFQTCTGEGLTPFPRPHHLTPHFKTFGLASAVPGAKKLGLLLLHKNVVYRMVVTAQRTRIK